MNVNDPQLNRELSALIGSSIYRHLSEELAETDKAMRRATGTELAWFQGKAQELELLIDLIDGSRERHEKAQAAAAQSVIRKQMF